MLKNMNFLIFIKYIYLKKIYNKIYINIYILIFKN